MGIIVSENEIQNCEMQVQDIFATKTKQKCQIEIDSIDEEENNEATPFFEVSNNDNISSDENDDNLENTAFVKMSDENGNQKRIRKSHYVWLLTDSKSFLSSDRLQRVKNAGSKQKRSACRRLEFNKTRNILNHNIEKMDQLQIGDWSIFCLSESSNYNHTNKKKYVVGNVLSFKYIHGKNEKDKVYTWDFVSFAPKSQIENEKEIEILGSWFEIDSSNMFHPIFHANSFYININTYIATIENSEIKLHIDTNGIQSIELNEMCFENIKIILNDQNV